MAGTRGYAAFERGDIPAVLLSGDTFKLEIHDFTASDDQLVVLTRESAKQGATLLLDNTVHVWHVKDGKATEFWGLSLDRYASNAFWG